MSYLQRFLEGLLILTVLALGSGRVAAQDLTPYEAGLTLRLYDIGPGFSHIPRLVDGQTPNADRIISRVDLSDDRNDFAPFKDDFLARILGRMTIAVDGVYTFRLSSDDGAVFYLNGQVLVEHDGLHSESGLENSIVLAAGSHEILIEFFESGGQAVLRLEWRPPGAQEFTLVPTEVLSTPKGVVRVTAPGRKQTRGRAHATAPGDGRPLDQVHPGYDVFSLCPKEFRPKVGGLDFLPDGRLALCTWDPEGAVYILDNIQSENPELIRVSRFAAGLAEPLGLKVVDGRIFVLQKQELTELIDHDQDGRADEYRCLSAGWSVSANFHEFAFGLEFLDGWFYFNLAIAIDPGGKSTAKQKSDRGRTARVHLETGKLEFVAEGLRTPNGIGRGPDKTLFLTDNQGDWVPVSKLMLLTPGAFYGSRTALPDEWTEKVVTPPVVWLPQNEIGNSPGECALFPSGPFAGHMAIADVTHGGVKRVVLETVDGVMQGVVLRFTQGLDAGINRLKFQPDGSLIVGGIGSGGNWGQEGKKKYGLQRLKPNGLHTFEILTVRSFNDGFLMEFSEPLAAGWSGETDFCRVQRWSYVPTAEYGGPKVNLTEIPVDEVLVAGDRRSAFLRTGELKADHVYYLRLNRHLRSKYHRALWSTEAWFTLNKVSRERCLMEEVDHSHVSLNQLTPEEKAAGFELLFDGKTFSAFRAFRGESPPETGWHIQDAALRHAGGEGGGDLVTQETYENFEFHAEWKVAPGANSGIMYLVGDDEPDTWRTGLEMQVLDDEGHADGRNPKTSAGALYGLLPCKRAAVRPAGEWNHVMIRVQNRHVTHELNGVIVVTYILGDTAWQEMVQNSKFAGFAKFGTKTSGRIALQDHGDEVLYRNLKIRRL